jgi:hypothetical protein
MGLGNGILLKKQRGEMQEAETAAFLIITFYGGHYLIFSKIHLFLEEIYD